MAHVGTGRIDTIRKMEARIGAKAQIRYISFLMVLQDVGPDAPPGKLCGPCLGRARRKSAALRSVCGVCYE